MKTKTLILAAAVFSSLFVSGQDIMRPIIPQNTAKLIIRQAVAEAKAYTDAAIKGGGGSTDVSTLSNEVAAVKADIVTLRTKVDAAPTASDVAAVAETASEAKGASTANTESIANLSTAVSGKLDTSTAASLYQPKGSYLQSETDPSVPQWAKAESKPQYDASEITYQNGFVSAYLSELNGKIPSVPGWALAENKPVYDATEITYGNGFVGAYLAELNGKIPVVPSWALNSVKPTYSASEITYGNGFVGDYLGELRTLLDTKVEGTTVYTKTEIDASFTQVEGNLALKAAKASVDQALARIALLEALVPETSAGIVADGSVNYSDTTKDLAIAGTLEGSSVIKVNTLKVNELTGTASPTNGAAIDVTAGTVAIKNSNLTGTTQAHHEFIRVKEAEEMVIEGVTFGGDTYNTIMTGQQTSKFLKKLTIKNCVFDENCKHVNVWFAGFQNNAELTIESCTFKTCEQFLCLSDFQGVGASNSLTVNLKNVTILNYEKGDVYEGIILCDDRVCTSAAQFREYNPFSRITINFSNVTAGGTKLTADNFVMGTGAAGQMLYLYSAKGGGVYPMSDENRGLFPTINFVE